MNIVTIRSEKRNHNLKLDFNRNISEVLEKLNIDLNDNQTLVSLLYKQVVNPKLSFIENGIANNEILEIKEYHEIEL